MWISLPTIALCLAGCDTPQSLSMSPSLRDIYESHLVMNDVEVKGLLDTCPPGPADGPILNVRALSAPQVAGVDMRVEFSQYMSHERASCVDAYLAEHGAKEFETDTIHWPSEETFFVSTTSTPSGTSTTTGP